MSKSMTLILNLWSCGPTAILLLSSAKYWRNLRQQQILLVTREEECLNLMKHKGKFTRIGDATIYEA